MQLDLTHIPGRQVSTNKIVAIKKIKLGQKFKDGLDMSAIREVKTLQELRHPNVIEVRPTAICSIYILRPIFALLKDVPVRSVTYNLLLFSNS